MESTSPGVLSHQKITEMIGVSPPLIAAMPDATIQIQPNGVDITLEAVSTFDGSGTIAVSNADRVLPDTVELDYAADGSLHLPPGPYHVRFNEIIALPDWLMAYARPRSSLLRAGVALHTAVWDAGYAGRGASLMVVYNPAGFTVHRNARIAQLVFHPLSSATSERYAGAYQHEGAPSV
jgi:dUTP pyrophosphatase